MSPKVLGAVRALGVVILVSVLTYFGDVSHLNGIVSASTATVISMIALAIEHMIEERTGKAMFGAVKKIG